jgi:diguanylate cyclase (GGDEF)-like protein
MSQRNLKIAILLLLSRMVWAAPAPLTTLSAIRALSNEEASQQLPVAFEGTVTYYRSIEHTLFLQDGDAAIYVNAPPDIQLRPGDRVLVLGRTRDSFRPFVLADSISVKEHTALPKALPATFGEMISAQTDCRLVSVRAQLRSADYARYMQYSSLQLLTESGYIKATVDGEDSGAAEAMLDAEVEITGVASEEFDSKMQVTGILLHVQSLADIKVLKPATGSPWTLPVTPMDRVLSVYHVQDATPRVRVHGTITYFEHGSAVILQDGAKSIWIQTETQGPLKIGNDADATGFPVTHNGFLELAHGEIRDNHKRAPVSPLLATWDMLTPRGNVSPGHHYDLVSIEGTVVTQVHEAAQDEYVLSTGGRQFSAIYRHLNYPPDYQKEVPIGSKVLVTGVCILENANPFIPETPFNILLRTPDDIVIMALPSKLTIGNLVRVMGGLFLLMLGVTIWGAMLKRKVSRQTAILAAHAEAEAVRERRLTQIESRRSAILEEINANAPLAGILEEIAHMASFCLDDAPCWCEVQDGARLGHWPPESAPVRIARIDIPGRAGSSVGTLFAAMRENSVPSVGEHESLVMAARLATLAIDTHRLYSDLLHRSEFDLLTDTHNRFSLNRHLNICIAEARNMAGVFGLIYIDLDEFKQINDVHGHRVGDLFLQEVADRLKKLLRSRDMVARLGGDEFALLLPVLHSRADVVEVAQRVERCFEQPLQIDGLILYAAASTGIALYPEDGTTRDALLHAADEAMYVNKNKRRRARGLAPLSGSDKRPRA